MWELDHFEQEGLIIYEHNWYYVLFAGGSKCILGNKLDLNGDICSSLFWGTSTALCWVHCVYSVSPYIWGKGNNCQIKVRFYVNFLIFFIQKYERCSKMQKKKKTNRNNPEKFSKLQNTSSPCRPQLWPNKLRLLHTVALISWGRFERAAGNHV